MNPIIKWAGGKRKVSSHISKLFDYENDNLYDYNTYFEPFFGGGAVFFSLAEKKNRFISSMVSDLNEDLVNFYQFVKKSPKDIVWTLKEGGFHNNEQRYKEIRKLDVNKITINERAARFIYLNKTSFNGLWRVNKAGQFNVPFGKYENPKFPSLEELEKASELLKDTTIMCCDYKTALHNVKGDDCVYLDPPYYPLSKTSNFTSYNNGSFSEQDHIDLFNEFERIKKKCKKVVLSNSSADFCIEQYKEHNIQFVDGTRSISGFSDKRKTVKEIIVN